MMKFILLAFMLLAMPAKAEISCNVTDVDADGDCPSGSVQIMRMNDLNNAHSRMPSLPPATYDYAVCCIELYGGTLGTSCPGDTGKRVGLANLSAASNAHAEKIGQNNYQNHDVCLSSTANVTMGYNDTSSCAAFDTCLFSMSADTNAHVGNCTAYARRVCASTHNLTLTVTEGNGTTVQTESYSPINITVTFFDVASGTYASGRTGKIFVERSPGMWDSGHGCTTNSNGNCSVSFVPDCTYSGGSAKIRGGPYGDSLYKDKNSTNATIIIDIGGRCANTVTLEMEINVSGSGGPDSYEVDGKGVGFYRPSDLANYYACTQDSAIANTPVFGIVFAGDQLNYINLTAGNESIMKVSEFIPGNKFILPATSSGCNNVKGKVPSISGGVMPQAFVSFIDTLKNTINIILSYPELDIVGDFTKTGTFALLMEKNVSGSTSQIIFRG